jgi:hypothetical protein
MIRRVSKIQLEKNKLKKIENEKMMEFFESIWNSRSEKDSIGWYVRCFETGLKMREDVYKKMKSVYHHVLYKSSYPQYKWNKDNVVIIRPDIHEQTHVNEEKTPNILKYRKKLLNLYKIKNNE